MPRPRTWRALLRQAYDDALNRYDLLLDAHAADEGNADAATERAAGAVLPARVRDAAQHLPVRRTGHPAMSIPCG